MKVKTTLYLHGDKESNYEKFTDLCEKAGIVPEPAAERQFAYALYEVTVEIEVDLNTGKYEIIGMKE